MSCRAERTWPPLPGYGHHWTKWLAGAANGFFSFRAGQRNGAGAADVAVDVRSCRDAILTCEYGEAAGREAGADLSNTCSGGWSRADVGRWSDRDRRAVLMDASSRSRSTYSCVIHALVCSANDSRALALRNWRPVCMPAQSGSCCGSLLTIQVSADAVQPALGPPSAGSACGGRPAEL